MPELALTDVESVRQFMQKSIADKLQDDDIEVLIGSASEAIQRHLNREFPSSTGTRSFEFQPNGNELEVVDLKPYEYRSVTTVVLDADLVPVTLKTAQVRPWPYPARDGTFFGLRLAELPAPKPNPSLGSLPELPFQTRRIDVTAEWGLGSVPAEVQRWANATVEAWVHLRREGGAPEVGFGEGPLPLAYDLPLPVIWGLKRWRRPTPSA